MLLELLYELKGWQKKGLHKPQVPYLDEYARVFDEQYRIDPLSREKRIKYYMGKFRELLDRKEKISSRIV